jgi:PAS domain S-box-containing protein
VNNLLNLGSVKPELARARLALPFLLAILIPLIGSVFFFELLGDSQWIHALTHSVIEAAGAAIALVVGALLLVQSRRQTVAPHFLWVSLALVCMGILDFFHALVEERPAFYWSRSLANLFGGILFMGAWLPDRLATPKSFRLLPVIVFAASFTLGVYFVVRPDGMPLMFGSKGYAPLAKAINFLGGIPFLLAAWNYFIRYSRTQRRENYLISLHCLLLGMAGVLFAFSNLWNSVWWFFHLLRFFAYILIIKYIFQSYQESLRNTESQLSLAVAHAQVGFYDWNLVTQRMVFSERMMKDWGIDPRNLHDPLEVVLELIHSEDRERVKELVDRAIRDGTPYHADYRVVHPDGKTVWVEVSGSVSYDKSGQPIRFFGTSVNITQRRQAEEDLKLERDKFQAVVRNTDVGIGLTDLQGKIVLLNPAGLTIHGFRSEAEMFAVLDYYIREFEIQYLDGRIMPLEEWPISRAMRGDYVRNYDLRLITRATGQMKVLSYSVAPVYDRTGVPRSFVFSIADLTLRERAERELRQTSEVLNAIMKSSPDVIYLKDRDSRMVYCNPVTLRLIGMSETELYGKNDVEFLGPGKGGEEILKTDDRIMTTGQGETVEEWVTWKNGTKRLYMSRKVPHRNPDGKIVGLIGISRDITDLKHAQTDLEDAVRARDEFLSIASHELKTPLTSLQLRTQILQRAIKKDDPAAFKPEKIILLVEQTDKQVSRLTRLVDDMLDVSRIRSGNLTMELEHCDLSDLVHEVIDRLKDQFRNASYDVPKVVLSGVVDGNWDRLRLEQVITNLLTNAIRYGNKKEIQVRLKNHENRVRLEVQDHGIGIPEELRERIFNRFERAVDVNEVSGLGLGLFITKQIVIAQGGRIWVESELGRGSTFIVEVPRQVPNELDHASVVNKFPLGPDERNFS